MSQPTYETHELALSLPADVRAPAAARAALGRLELDAPLLETLRLLVNELVTNSVRHAGLRAANRITVAAFAGAVIVVTMSDPGCGFANALIGPRRADEGGWDLHIVQRAASRWGVEPGHPTFVWFELAR
jgi:anti-sigma regulatory factor (Ser/Thr protein kinase)